MWFLPTAFNWNANRTVVKNFYANLALNFSVETQNRLIKEQELQIQNYVCDIDSMKAYALKEYERAFNATKDDKTCEGRLKHLETILKSYED